MTIKEVSKKYGISTNPLRYYERVGLFPRVKRTASGIRDFDEEACDWVEFIKYMRDCGILCDIVRIVARNTVRALRCYIVTNAERTARRRVLHEDERITLLEFLRCTTAMNSKIDIRKALFAGNIVIFSRGFVLLVGVFSRLK